MRLSNNKWLSVTIIQIYKPIIMGTNALWSTQLHFYRAMHVVLERHCYRKLSVRLSVPLFVCLSDCPSVTLWYPEHIGCKTRKPSWRKGKRATAVRVWRPLAKKSTENLQLMVSRGRITYGSQLNSTQFIKKWQPEGWINKHTCTNYNTKKKKNTEISIVTL